MNAAAWVLAAMFVIACLALVVTIGGNQDLAAENRDLRKLAADEAESADYWFEQTMTLTAPPAVRHLHLVPRTREQAMRRHPAGGAS